MDLRYDALTGAAEIVTAIEDVGSSAAADGDVVATVGDITAVDGAINKVCGEVSFPIDIRSVTTTFRDRVESRILDRVEEIADRRGLAVEVDELDRSEPVALDDEMNDLLADGAETLDISHQRLPSGGGHDAMNFQLSGIPTGLVFTPSKDGISHNPREETDSDAILDATRLVAFSLANYDSQ
jgi:acetylornithine deacetylase/succinyl-diaminopimelate desuccinylase-like protein